MINWNADPICTWIGTIDIDSDGYIASTTTEAVDKATITVKGQNSASTSEPESYGSIGNAFADIFSLPRFIEVYRRTNDYLVTEE